MPRCRAGMIASRVNGRRETDDPMERLMTTVYIAKASCRARALAAAAALPFVLSCGSASPASPSGSPSDPTHTLPQTVMILDTGPIPRDITVAVGATVTFMNHDSVAHGVAGGSDAAGEDCPELDAVGVLQPFEIRASAPFASAKTCQYHDPRTGSDTFTGRIVVR